VVLAGHLRKTSLDFKGLRELVEVHEEHSHWTHMGIIVPNLFRLLDRHLPEDERCKTS
jgi:hypothetical protein